MTSDQPERPPAVRSGGSAADTRGRCSWCGAAVERDDGYRAAEPAAEQVATFCRLEHVVPWAMQGRRWEPGELTAADRVEDPPDVCAHCGEPLDEALVVLVRRRGEARVPDAFCSVDHMGAWARAGGRWG